jgi:hypothetical protein
LPYSSRYIFRQVSYFTFSTEKDSERVRYAGHTVELILQTQGQSSENTQVGLIQVKTNRRMQTDNDCAFFRE